MEFENFEIWTTNFSSFITILMRFSTSTSSKVFCWLLLLLLLADVEPAASLELQQKRERESLKKVTQFSIGMAICCSCGAEIAVCSANVFGCLCVYVCVCVPGDLWKLQLLLDSAARVLLLLLLYCWQQFVILLFFLIMYILVQNILFIYACFCI